jgi:hypothetical protein
MDPSIDTYIARITSAKNKAEILKTKLVHALEMGDLLIANCEEEIKLLGSLRRKLDADPENAPATMDRIHAAAVESYKIVSRYQSMLEDLMQTATNM